MRVTSWPRLSSSAATRPATSRMCRRSSRPRSTAIRSSIVSARRSGERQSTKPITTWSIHPGARPAAWTVPAISSVRSSPPAVCAVRPSPTIAFATVSEARSIRTWPSPGGQAPTSGRKTSSDWRSKSRTTKNTAAAHWSGPTRTRAGTTGRGSASATPGTLRTSSISVSSRASTASSAAAGRVRVNVASSSRVRIAYLVSIAPASNTPAAIASTTSSERTGRPATSRSALRQRGAITRSARPRAVRPPASPCGPPPCRARG